MPRPREFNHQKVIEQAMQVFWQNGYEATSISDLTAATGLKPGSLYNTFGSKHAIYLEALDYYESSVGGQLFAVLDEPISGIRAIETLFNNLIEAELNDPQQRGCFMQNAILERASCDPDVKQRACAGKEQGVAIFKQTLERAHRAGELKSDLDIEQAAHYLVGMVYAIRTLARTTDSRTELTGVIQTALSVLR